MRINSFVAVTALMLCGLPGWNAFAANPDGGSETFAPQAEEAPVAQPTAATPVNIEEGMVPKVDEPQMEQRPTPATNVRVRSTRPRNDPHRDARACLDKENKTAIIICAEKFR
ncbi:MAG: hypothetical protein ABL878_00895 [Burkholderiales bacterium]